MENVHCVVYESEDLRSFNGPKGDPTLRDYLMNCLETFFLCRFDSDPLVGALRWFNL